ncbi:MAG: hypothetical protein ACKOGH_14420 [Alphaproteobacteria bacterium]
MAIDRRSLLPALAASLALGSVAPRALAFRVVEEEDTPRVRALLEACETRGAHERLVRQLIEEIEGRGETRDAAVEKVRDMACPLCGCNLALQVPDAAKPPGF